MGATFPSSEIKERSEEGLGAQPSPGEVRIMSANPSAPQVPLAGLGQSEPPAELAKDGLFLGPSRPG